MNALALSAVAVVAGGALFIGAACSSSSSGPGFNSYPEAAAEDVVVETGDDGTEPTDGGSEGGEAAADGSPACPWPLTVDAGAPSVPDTPDAATCGSCIVSKCGEEWSCCANDPTMTTIKTSDGGAPNTVPACTAFVSCVEAQILAGGDAGAQGAIAACATGPDGGSTVPEASTSVGHGLLSCFLVSCTTQCGL
jgi:hypothetical protein